MIEIKDLRAGYGKREILHGVSLNVKRGKILSVIGPNGCGKSTLLKTLSGIIPYTAGNIELDGEKFSNMARKTRAKRIAYLPQDRPVPEMNVGRLVLNGRFPHLSFGGSFSRDDISAAERAVERLGLEGFLSTPLRQLSGGIRQKAYIAMALAQGADCLLLDEPFTHLDVPHRYALADLMTELAANGIAVVAVMHEIADALAVSDALAVMYDGKIIFTGTPDELTASDVLPAAFGVRYVKVSHDEKVSYFPARI